MPDPLGIRGRLGRGPLGGGRGGGRTEFRSALRELEVGVVTEATASCDTLRGGPIAYSGLELIVALGGTSSVTGDCC